MLVRILALSLLLCATPIVLRAQDTMSDDLREIKQQLQDIKSILSNNVSSIAKNRQDIEELRTQFNQQTERQRQILDAISTEDSSGRRIPKLSAIMQESEEFREDLRGAVHDSLENEGTLHLSNRTNEFRRIFVNRTEYGIEPGKTVTLKVPVGTITTRLPGQDIENWTLAAPDYQEKIDIVPKTTSTITSYSPTTTQTVYYTAPTEPVTTYYPSTTAYYPTTTTYYPTTTAYSPTTTYYPTTAYYPTTTAYYPTTSYYYPTTSYYYPTTSYYYSSWWNPFWW